MLIRPDLLSNELDRGYMGRLMQLNGKQDSKETLSLAATWLERCENSDQEFLPIEILSKVSGKDLKNFVCQHTTLPFRRSITAYAPDISHGDENSRSMLKNSAMRTARSGAYFCKECMTEEYKNIGFSYWHRDQQIPGLLWCPDHQIPLSHVIDEKSFLYSPGTFSTTSTITSENNVEKFKNSETIQRFLKISHALMERKNPLDNRHVAFAMKQRAINKKLRNNGGQRNASLLSDLVYKSFNKNWLKKTFPVMQEKFHGTAMSQLDGIFYGKKASPPVTAYILAASVLYDTAEDALNDLTSCQTVNDTRKPHDPNYRVRMDDSKLRELYICNGGDHSAAAVEIQRKKISVKSRLTSLGLPNLSERSGASSAFIMAFLIDGKSLSESRDFSGIDDKTMERVLRTIGNPFVQVIKEINKSRPNDKAKT